MMGISSILGVLIILTSVSANFRIVFNNIVTTERIDPIVNPGTVANHAHVIVGGSNISPSANSSSMQASACTSAPIMQDKSGYWTPQLYYRYPNGQFLSVPGFYHPVTVYYGFRDVSPLTIRPFPEGFRMLAGNSNLRSFNTSDIRQRKIGFICYDKEHPSGTWSPGLPNKICGLGMRVEIIFPSCWDGINLDTNDHRSHVAYPPNGSGGRCTDPRWPVPLLEIKYKLTYDVGQFAGMWYGDHSPFVLANGDPTGYGMHGDFLNGWNQTVLEEATATCESAPDLKSCPVFKLSSAACIKSKPSFDELITNTLLDVLPGCNPIWNGTAPQPSCTASSTLRTTSRSYPTTTTPRSTATHAVPLKQTSLLGWRYQGCFADSVRSRLFSQKYQSILPMSLPYCIGICKNVGFSLAGVESGTDCWCADSGVDTVLSNARTKDANCNIICPGNSTETCGGHGYLDVFSSQTDLFSDISVALSSTPNRNGAHPTTAQAKSLTNFPQKSQVTASRLGSAAVRTDSSMIYRTSNIALLSTHIMPMETKSLSLKTFESTKNKLATTTRTMLLTSTCSSMRGITTQIL